MRTSPNPSFSPEWFVISIRWLTLTGLAVSLALGNGLIAPVNLILGLVALWNITFTLLAGLNKRIPYAREVNLAVDALATIAYFLLQGLATPAFWIIILPVFSAAIYFRWTGALVSAGAMTALVLFSGIVLHPEYSNITVIIIIAALPLFVGVLFGFLNSEIASRGREARSALDEKRSRTQRIEGDRMSAIYKLTTTLTATLNYQRVLDSALDLSLQALKSDIHAETDNYLVSAVLLFEKEELKVGSARRFTPADIRKTVPARRGVIADAVNDGEPIVGENPTSDPELSTFAALHNCNSYYIFPLRSGFSVYGVMIFAHPEKNYFGADRREMLEIIGRQAVVAISNARLYDDVRKEKERIIEVQEEARKKLARDLHDGPTQSVAAMAMRVNLTRRMIEKDPKEAANELVKIEELARRTTKEIRHMLFTLRPLVLESQGLVAALQDMATKMKETYSQNVVVQMDDNVVQELEIGKTGVIFYIVEEAVNNARKHAQAETIWVRLRPLEKDKEIVLLEIADNGVGFDVDAVNKNYDKRGSLGMVNLRERSELVNGVLNITSVIGKGTNTQVYIPLSEEAQDRLHHRAK